MYDIPFSAIIIIVIIIAFFTYILNNGFKNVNGGVDELIIVKNSNIEVKFIDSYLTYLNKYFKNYVENIKLNLNDYLNLGSIDDIIKHNNLPNYLYWSNELQHINSKKEHPGQVKLLLMETLFLAKYIDTKPDIVVYVGAGPGLHLLMLMELFPNLYFHFWDCRFDERLKREEKNGKYKLFQRYFEQKDCAQYVGKKILFMSDIRALTMSEKNVSDQNTTLIENQQMQWDWIREIKPMVSMLKFRLPFESKSIQYEYCDGEIYVQPYTSPWSAESRLIVHNPEKIKIYNNFDYENKFVFFNYVIKHCILFNYKGSDSIGINELYMYWIIDYYHDKILGVKDSSFDIIKNFTNKLNSSIYKESEFKNNKNQKKKKERDDNK
jgi:hypothetical protein